MALGRGDVLAVQMPVEVDRGVDFLHDGAGARREPPAPHFVAHVAALGTSTEVLPMKRRLFLILAGGIAGFAAALAAVYGIAGLTGNAAENAACRPAVELASKIAPLATGEVAAVNVAKSPLTI